MLSDGRKVVDSFLVSEPHEAEVLLAKFHAGAGVVDEFVAIEGAYTFRGEWKGLWLRRALLEDPRFQPFMNKVYVVECHENLFEKMRLQHREHDYFKVEFASRELSRPYIQTWYSDRDLVTCSDVDEMLDFSDPERARLLDERLTRSAGRDRIAWVDMLKFWYDFDNVSVERKWFPAGPLSRVRTAWRQRQAHPDVVDVYEAEPYLAFEYSYCFPREAIVRKLSTFSHDKFTPEDVDRALAGNYWCKCAAKGERPGDRGKADYFRTVALTAENSTSYVRDNLERLKTWNVQKKENNEQR